MGSFYIRLCHRQIILSDFVKTLQLNFQIGQSIFIVSGLTECAKFWQKCPALRDLEILVYIELRYISISLLLCYLEPFDDFPIFPEAVSSNVVRLFVVSSRSMLHTIDPVTRVLATVTPSENAETMFLVILIVTFI